MPHGESYCSTLGTMTEQPDPVVRSLERAVSLTGTMAVYNSQSEASEGIPQQWREFRSILPWLDSNSKLYGASPCTNDGKIHYLAGAAQESPESFMSGEHLILAAGEYAMVRVDNPALLRDTWGGLLGRWLPASGRQEKHAPEFERYSSISETGAPIGPVEIWIPLEALTKT